MVSFRENSQHARELIQETIEKWEILPNTLTIHSDRGSPMTSKTVSQLLEDLNVKKTHSRPYVSNDNPFSEAAFKTLKYCPEFPSRFGCIEDSRIHCNNFYNWYNYSHHHSGIAMLTPYDVHFGNADRILEQRQNVLNSIYDQHPERFPKGKPRVKKLDKAVWINKPGKNVSWKDKILVNNF